LKTLVITGASSGIGFSTAKLFGQKGYQIINISRRHCDLNSVKNISCDLSKKDSLESIEGELKSSIEKSDSIILINNASKMNTDRVDSTHASDLREVFEINLVAPNILNGFCIPYMRPGSSILYVGSTLSEKAVPGSFSYVTSKHALVGMMRATCQDLAGEKIHTACVCPGFTDTEMLREHIPEDVMPAIQAMSAYERLITPEEIAEALFWASQNPIINGSLIHANLGQIER